MTTFITLWIISIVRFITTFLLLLFNHWFEFITSKSLSKLCSNEQLFTSVESCQHNEYVTFQPPTGLLRFILVSSISDMDLTQSKYSTDFPCFTIVLHYYYFLLFWHFGKRSCRPSGLVSLMAWGPMQLPALPVHMLCPWLTRNISAISLVHGRYMKVRYNLFNQLPSPQRKSSLNWI